MNKYVEDYIETIQSFPGELKKNLIKMRTLDETSQTLSESVFSSLKDILESAKYNKQELKDVHLPSLRADLTKAFEATEEKIAIAAQTYEIVDKHIQRLDDDLAKIEAELKNKSFEEKTKMTKKKKGKEDSISPKKKRKLEEEKEQLEKIKEIKSVQTDLQIDPNEPTFCLCHRVSFGDMVACDNPKCEIEWFHYECVGLTSPPIGKWYCPNCTPKLDQAL